MMMKRGHVMNGSRRPFLTVGVVLFAAALLGAPHECGARVVREARLGMVADWPEQSVAAHASEFLRANVPTAFWEFVRNVEIDDDGAAAPLSAKAWASTNATLAKVVSPVQLRAAEVAVATRLYSPRLEYLHSAAMEILRAAGMDEKALPEVFLSADGVPIVQLEDLSRAFSSDFTDRTHLRLRNADIGVLSGPSLRYRQFVVFGRVGDQKTKEFLIQVQQELEKHGEVVGFCHFDAKRASRPQTTPIQGYGVSLTVKSTEYRVSNPEDSRTNVASSDDEAQTLRDREEDGVEGEVHRSFGFALPKLVSAAGKRIEELWKEKPAKAFVEQQNAIDDFTVDESNSAVSTAQFLSALSEEKEHKISRLISLLEHYPSQRKALLEQRVSERVEGRRFDSASVQDFDLNLETPFSTLQSLLSLSSAYNVMERFSSHSNQGDRIARLDIDPDGVLWLRNNENMKSASSDVEKIFHGGRVKHNVIDVVLVLNPFSVSDYDLVEQLFNRLSSYSGVRVGFVFTAHKNGDGKSTLDMQFSPRQESDGSDPVTLRQFLRALNAIWNAHKGEKRKMILAVLRAISDSNGELSHASLVQLYHEVAARGNAKVEVSNMAQVLLHEKHDALGDQFLRFCTEHNVVLLEKSNVVLVNGVATPLKNVDGVLQMELGAFRKHIDEEDDIDDAYLVRSFRAKRATGAKAIKLESSTSLQDYDRYFAAELASASLPRGKIGAGRFPLHCFGDVEDEMGRRMLLSCASAVTYGCNASVTFVPRCRDAKRCGGTASAIAEAVSAEQVINALASAPSPGSHVPTCNAPPSLCHSNAIVFAGRSVSLHGARCDHTARSPASCQLLYGSALAAMVNAEARTLEAAGAKDVQDALLYTQHAALLVARDKELPQAGDGALGEGDVSSPLRISAAVRLREPQTAWILPLLQRTASVLQARLDIDLYEGGNVNENVAKKVFRTFAFDPRVRFHSSGAMLRPRAILRALPQKTLFSADIDSPDRWVTSVRNATADMDNIVLESRPGDLRATYTLHAMAIEGTVTSTGCNFNGLELVSESALGSTFTDTTVMGSGYYQNRLPPGLWFMRMREGRSRDLRTFVEWENHHTELQNITLAVDSYLARDEFVLIAPRKGQDAIFWDIQEKRAADESKAADEFIRSFFAMHPDAEHSLASLTRQDAGDSSGGNARTSSQDKINALLRTLFQSNDDASPNGESTGNEEASSDPSSASEAAQVAQTRPAVDPDTIHVFSVASGHLYERLLRIMILSVIKHTKRPVKFWFIRNFLSAQCMALLSKMSTKYGFRYELVTYTWPVWLRKQTEKQRFIWAYKILFLDVLFPIDVKRIIFIDADQVVRTDMAELYDMDIGDNALAFTPFCNSNEETKGFRFWEGGYWAQILPRGKYHISALFMVDLEKFRLNGIGDSYRQTYQQLTGDPNSLANLDQDLPNYMQTTGVSIYSLPQEWLWCETWCSAESKAKAKTIDLCNNPLYKTHKLEMAKKIIPEWESYDDELKALELE